MYQASENSGPVVFSSDEKPGPKPPRYSLSIKFIAYTSATIIIFLFLGITAINLSLSKGHYQDSNGNLPPYLTNRAIAIETQLSLFNKIVKHVATQPTTQDILEHRNEADAQVWAIQMRRFLPQAMGVTLLTPNGKVLGDPPDQRLTPQCLTDMSKINQHEATKIPAVHTDTEGVTHFDITAYIYDEAENQIGLLFVSFGMDSLKPLLRKESDAPGRLGILDGYGTVFSQPKNSAQQGNSNGSADTVKSLVNIAGTDWQLRLIEPGGELRPSFLILAIFNVFALILTVGIIGLLVRYITRSMVTDFEQVKSLLNNLAEGEPLEAELATPKLRETAEVFPALTHINRNIDKKQQLLENQELSDRLTGLSNRRQFNIEFARAYDFARRGTPVCIVLMRITGLEKLNQSQAYQVVKVLGKTLEEHARKVDHPARLDYGEFALLMFGASPEGTTPCLERICRSFRKHQIEHPAIPKDHTCTLYCGYTRIHAHRDKNAAQVLKRAEAALGEAVESSDHHIISK